MMRPVNSSTMTTWPSLNQVILVAMEQDMCLQGLLDVVADLHAVPVGHLVEAGQIEEPLDLGLTFIGQSDGAVLLVDLEVAGVELLARLLAFDHLAADQASG